MGFNKRYINKENLSFYKKRNIQELISYVKNPDCLIYEDNYSSKICSIILNNNDTIRIQSKLVEIGFYES